MSDLSNIPNAKRPRRLERAVLRARAVLFWEALWPRLAPSLAGLALVAALGLLGVLTALPGWLHAGVLAAAVAAIAVSLRRNLRSLRVPDDRAGRRRLERASHLPHRPLTGLDDVLATGRADPASASLWEAHRTRLQAVLHRLRTGWPNAGLAARDPLALRAVPLLLLAAGLIVSGPQTPTRLAEALTPDLSGTSAPPAKLSVWIDPPGYTGRAPQVLKAKPQPQAPESIVRVSEGSRVLAQVEGGAGQPHLRLGDIRQKLEKVGANAWKGEVELGRNGLDLPGATDMAVVQNGAELAQWPLHLLMDQKPEVRFTQPPKAGQRKALSVHHAARDDYGLSELRLRVTRPGESRIETIVRRLPLVGDDAAKSEGQSYHDLTAHIWAGLKVEMTLVAEDALGQTGRSETVTVQLPERAFKHPVARRIVELRKQLARHPEDREPVIAELRKLQARPSAFFGDLVVALGLRSAERRLAYDGRFDGLRSVQELLWRIALRIEDGELAIAERDLRRAEQALQEALNNPETGEAELSRLMDKLEAAMSRFMETMAQRMQQQMRQGHTSEPLPEGARTLETRDLQKMLDKMRDMAESGAREGAREMLSQLQRMMENLRMAPGQGQRSAEAQKAQELMQQLQSLTQRQQELLDQTFRQAQPQQGQAPDEQPQAGPQGQGVQQQEGLRQDLGELMREYGNMTGQIPRQLGDAEQQMRGAARALGEGKPGKAVQPQSNALDNLRQGMQAMRENLQRRLQGQRQGEGRGGQGSWGFQSGDPRDPLGRRQGETGRGGLDRSNVEIPSDQALQRAREILNELRNRAGDRERPALEQDYIRRLLERF